MKRLNIFTKKVLLAAGFVVVALLFLFYQFPQWFVSFDQEELLKRGMLIVSDQQPGATITIDYATLPFGGFIVVRNDFNGNLGDVIGVSQYLEPGRYKSIRIPALLTTATGQTVAAGIVKDNGNQHLDSGDQLLFDVRNNPFIREFIIGTPPVTPTK
ncbi:MAG: hypothetical protein V1846_05600 [Candidatus Komeilibacteria bacterium]